MAAPTASSLSALLKNSSLEDHEQILEACNKTLKTSSSDIQAQHVKVVALLKLDRYEEAVKFVEGAGDNLRKTAALEYAYALYKTGRLQEAVEVSSQLQERGARHVEAQARYRLEDALKTLEVYERLKSQGNANEDFDLRVNQSAIDAQVQWLGVAESKSIRKTAREDLEAFETAYNAACGSIARGEYAQAEILLRRAKEICKHSDELTDQQRREELLPISVQQLFVLLCLGKTAEAEEIAHEINTNEALDVSTRKVAQNNLLLTSPIDNPFLAYKSFHMAPKVPSEDKLFSYQDIPLKSNETTLDLQAYKFDGLTKSASQPRPLSLSPDHLLSSYSQAAARAKNETNKAAIRRILPALEREPNSIGTIITLVQLYVLCGNSTSAVELLESSLKRLEASVAEEEQDIRFNAVLLSILISLYKHRGQRAHVKQELAKAASHWRTRSNAPASLLSAAGVSLLESQNDEDIRAASDIFAKLKEQQPQDKATTAGYVASHVVAEGSQDQLDTDKLTPVEDLIRDVDVTAIENAGIPQPSNALAIAQLGTTRKRGAPNGGEAKPKRIRKSRLPKDYDANKKPDPERWLPMKDRSYYRPPKGKKKNKRGGETQGGVVNEDLNVDAKPATTTVATASGGNKKKKGKGKK